MAFNRTVFTGSAETASIEARLELGHELLYEKELGLFDVVHQLLDEIDQDPLLPHHQRFLEFPTDLTRIELYRTARPGNRGVSVRRVIGGRTLNTETDTITIPSVRVFATPDHQLSRLGANNQMPNEYGGPIMHPPSVVTNRTALVDRGLMVSMDHFLRDYLTTAQGILNQLISD